jgi:hypothetical protein
MLNRIKRLDIEAVAGLIAAISALVLHLLHIIEPDVLLVVVMVILALMLIRDFRREERDESAADASRRMEEMLTRVLRSTSLPDTTLVGPQTIREESAAFSRGARGDMVWFNVCLSMFEPQELFDILLRPALESPQVRSVQFVLDPGERERWERAVLPKAEAIGTSGKLRPPVWVPLAEPVSCILAETEATGRMEALLSFWGEPFMARGRDRDIPRYVFRVHAHSELVPHLSDLARRYRLQ